MYSNKLVALKSNTTASRALNVFHKTKLFPQVLLPSAYQEFSLRKKCCRFFSSPVLLDQMNQFQEFLIFQNPLIWHCSEIKIFNNFSSHSSY